MTPDRFEFKIDLEIAKLGPVVANPANLANQQEASVSRISKISEKVPPDLNRKEPSQENFVISFQERASIREYEGGQPRVEAELGALEEVLPHLKDGKELIIPHNTPQRYRWWQGGQAIETTLRELGASDEMIKRYVWDRSSGTPKPEGAE